MSKCESWENFWEYFGFKDETKESYGGFLKWWYPQNTPKWSFLVGKPMVVGYHHFRKPPYSKRFIEIWESILGCIVYTHTHTHTQIFFKSSSFRTHACGPSGGLLVDFLLRIFESKGNHSLPITSNQTCYTNPPSELLCSGLAWAYVWLDSSDFLDPLGQRPQLSSMFAAKHLELQHQYLQVRDGSDLCISGQSQQGYC